MFIVGTVEDKGRCSSHPPRNVKSPKKSPSPPRESDDRAAPAAALVPTKPFSPAWLDQLHVAGSGSTRRLEVVAIHTPLSTVARSNFGNSGETTSIFVAPSSALDIRHTFENIDFILHSQGLVSISPAKEETGSTTADSVLLFLFEHNSPLAPASFQDAAAQIDGIRQLGPAYFQRFPSHHFFTRVYRPSAITTSLLNRTSTFCAEQDWLTLPFELHHKTSFDSLLDTLARTTCLLQQLDHITSLDPTLARRSMAQELLGNCLGARAQLEQWYISAFDPRRRRYWISHEQGEQIPFPEPFAFQDPLASLSFTYYWAAQVLLAPCLETAVHSVFSPAVDAYPHQAFPDLPPQLAIDPDSYGTFKVREMAVNVCRGLDYALAVTTQPDALVFPVKVVETFYAGLANQTGDGTLELMWLGAFRERMASRARDIAGVMMEKDWVDLAEW